MSEDLGIRFVRPEGGVSMKAAIGEKEIGSEAYQRGFRVACTSMFLWLMHCNCTMGKL